MRQLMYILVLFIVLLIYTGCEVLINPSAEINVLQNDTEILSGGEYDFGQILVGESSQTVSFTIESLGNTKLILSGNPDLISVTADTSDFVIDQSNVTTPLKPGKSTDFEITFIPTSNGAKSVTILIANNDLDEDPYTIIIKGEGTVPEINVKQGTTDILSGSGVYDFGEIKIGETSPEITFTIENTGTGNLELTNTTDLISVKGVDASMFTINHTSTESTISPGESTTFTVNFTPTSDGTKQGSISISNSDSDENPYIFSIIGSGMDRPEIAVYDPDSQEIQNDVGKYNFVNVRVNDNLTETFEIHNVGIHDLLITGNPRVSIISTGDSVFSVETQPSDKISPGGNSIFTIKFEPTKSEVFQATVSIANNDADENPYTFTITGKGVEPEINVKQGSTDIPSGTGSYDFGLIKVDNSSQAITFTIENLGGYELDLTGSPDLIEIGGADATMFSLNQSATTSPVIYGTPTTFTITFTPTSDGLKTATISIANDDADENPYTFTITGTGFYEPEINIKDMTLIDIPNKTGLYDFGDFVVNKTKYAFFYIENLGKAMLNLTGTPMIEIKGSGASAFKVEILPTINIAPSSNDTFWVSFTPTNAQEYNATVSIANNDSDENPYTFNIKGKGIEPEINIKDSSPKDIANGTGIFTFEDTPLGRKDNETFTIENLGEYILLLTGTPIISISGPGASAFSITSLPLTSINPSSSTTFTIEFAPTTDGVINATVSIANTDSDENPYTFTITGNGLDIKTGFDFNGDGLDDYIVGAYSEDTGAIDAGAAYIFYGTSTPPSSLNASSADVKIIGENDIDTIGFIVGSIGDYNGDGFDDVIIASDNVTYNGKKCGAVYIILGGANVPKSIDASNADVRIYGDDEDYGFGHFANSAGDFNGDGLADVIIGVPNGSLNYTKTGYACIYLGTTNPKNILSPSDADIKLIGEALSYNDYFGYSVSSASDFNDDGIDDVIVSAEYSDVNGYVHSGKAYVFFGNTIVTKSINATDADVIISGEYRSYFGTSVASAGDFNDDGIDDIIIGAMFASFNNQTSGAAYIFFGKTNPVKSIDASSADFIIYGEGSDTRLGSSVASAGDYNNDGIDDVIIGAPWYAVSGYGNGRAYIVFGSKNPSSSISAAKADVIIKSVAEKKCFGCCVTYVGDLNHDGVADVLVCTYNIDSANPVPGSVYIFYGSSNPASQTDETKSDIKVTGEHNTDRFGCFAAGGK